MYRITVLMSTFNGEKYLLKQLLSIIKQKECDVHLIVRDDGSIDSSVEILEKFRKEYPEKIEIIKGKNVGYRKSFSELLTIDDESDYYAFADQDDVWLDNKCLMAINRMACEKMLYASSTIITDNELNKINFNDITSSPNNIKSYFIRHRLAGCTMVFDKKIKCIAEECIKIGIENQFIDHDFLIGAIAYSFGSVVRDEKSYILHRRSEDSVTSGGKGIIDRIKTEKFIVFDRKNINFDIAKLIIKYQKKYNEKININAYEFLQNILQYKNSKSIRSDIIKDKEFTSGINLCDIEAKLKILLKNF